MTISLANAESLFYGEEEHRRNTSTQLGGDMEFHRGRLIDHVHLRVADLAASRRFYAAALAALGHLDAITEGADHFSADELWVDMADGPVSRVHLAFQARDHDEVGRFFAAAVAAGGKDNGGPGERAYHPGYYAAYVLDPDGNNIEAVYHGPTSRSAESIVVTALDGAADVATSTGSDLVGPE
jgi:catechol 2,3-dioxygenase-like lactoylglutathione lyase family enzyme